MTHQLTVIADGGICGAACPWLGKYGSDVDGPPWCRLFGLPLDGDVTGATIERTSYCVEATEPKP